MDKVKDAMGSVGGGGGNDQPQGGSGEEKMIDEGKLQPLPGRILHENAM